MNGSPRIGILFETAQDFQVIKRHLGQLADWEVPYCIMAASALKSPERLGVWMAERERQGVEVFIVAVGGAANLAGAVAAQTDRPVIGVPLDTTHLRGQDALFAMTGLPTGVPVASVGINNIDNALYCALRILALRYAQYRSIFERLRGRMAKREAELIDNLRDQYPELFQQAPTPAPEMPEPPADGEAPAPATSKAAEEELADFDSDFDDFPAAPKASKPAKKPAKKPLDVRASRAEKPAKKPPAARASRAGTRVIAVNPKDPEVSAIEEVADILLGGGIVALPTDTVYGLAVVATDNDAVLRLYGIKKRKPKKPIPLLLDSVKALQHIVRDVPEAAQPLFESFWPGALTLIFQKHPTTFAAVTVDDTIGLRMPDHMVTLAVISMLARPLAATSANVSNRPAALTADEVKESFGDVVDCILDAGPAPGEKASTVLSVIESPFRILREGAISFDELKKVLGDQLAEE